MSVITTVLAPAASNGMIDVAMAKDELSITGTANDAWLSRVIGQVSRAMMNATNRVFAPEYVQDLIDIKRMRSQVPGGVWQLQLTRFPVLAVASVIQVSTELSTTRTLVQETDFRVDYDTGALIRIDSATGMSIAWEALPVTVRYVAGYGTAVSEAHSGPASSPYQIVVAQAAAFSCDQSVAYANGTLLVSVSANPAHGQYSVDGSTGTYTLNAADALQSLILNYATSDPPEDLQEACLRLVTARFRAKGRDPALVQREQPGIGVERFWFGGVPGQTGTFPPDIEAALDNYHVPVVA